MGRAGFEPATLGLKVQLDELRADARPRNVQQITEVSAAMCCGGLWPAETSLYARRTRTRSSGAAAAECAVLQATASCARGPPRLAMALDCLPRPRSRVTMRRMSMLGNSHRHVAELVARDRELALLEAAFDEATMGRGRVGLVTAEAGGGKTALIDSFCTARTGRARVLRGACDALFTPRPLGPIHDFAANLEAELEQMLRGEAVPYQVAAAL